MVDMFASVLVFTAGTYLVGLAAVALISPSKARAFLGGFAGSASAHYLELCVRLVVGAALLRCAPQMPFPRVFAVFGWMIVVTGVALLAIPWQWYRRFARWAVPLATLNLKLFAFSAFVGGALIVLSVVLGPWRSAGAVARIP